MPDIIAQTIVLSNTGFPAPADSADVGMANHLLYFSKSKGTPTARALETTIRNFDRVINDSTKLSWLTRWNRSSLTEPLDEDHRQHHGDAV